MALRDLIKNYLRDAEVANPGDTAAQIVWAEAKRVTLAADVEAGDWAVNSGSFDGQSHSSSRGIPAREMLAAIISVLDKLEGVNGGGAGGILQPQLNNIPL